LLEDEEKHYDWLTSQLTVIKQVGLERYLNGMREEPKEDEEDHDD